MSPLPEPKVQSGAASKAGHLILDIQATRTSAGIHVEMIGGADLRKIFEACSIRDGSPRPKINLFGIPDLNVWVGGYEIENVYPCSIPPALQFGVWVIRHAALGIEEKTTFTLPVPHSQGHIESTVRQIVDASNTIFRQYAPKVVVRGEARHDPDRSATSRRARTSAAPWEPPTYEEGPQENDEDNDEDEE